MQANQANVTFDTHKAIKALKSAGFDEKQAEGVVETIDKAVNETVATKADLAILEAELKVQGAKIDALKENIDKNMATKTELMRMMLIQTLVVVGMLIPVIGMLIPVVIKLL